MLEEEKTNAALVSRWLHHRREVLRGPAVTLEETRAHRCLSEYPATVIRPFDDHRYFYGCVRCERYHICWRDSRSCQRVNELCTYKTLFVTATSPLKLCDERSRYELVRLWRLYIEKHFFLYNVVNGHQCFAGENRTHVIQPFEGVEYFYGCTQCGKCHICYNEGQTCDSVDRTLDTTTCTETCNYSGQAVRNRTNESMGNYADEMRFEQDVHSNAHHERRVQHYIEVAKSRKSSGGSGGGNRSSGSSRNSNRNKSATNPITNIYARSIEARPTQPNNRSAICQLPATKVVTSGRHMPQLMVSKVDQRALDKQDLAKYFRSAPEKRTTATRTTTTTRRRDEQSKMLVSSGEDDDEDEETVAGVLDDGPGDKKERRKILDSVMNRKRKHPGYMSSSVSSDSEESVELFNITAVVATRKRTKTTTNDDDGPDTLRQVLKQPGRAFREKRASTTTQLSEKDEAICRYEEPSVDDDPTPVATTEDGEFGASTTTTQKPGEDDEDVDPEWDARDHVMCADIDDESDEWLDEEEAGGGEEQRSGDHVVVHGTHLIEESVAPHMKNTIDNIHYWDCYYAFLLDKKLSILPPLPSNRSARGRPTPQQHKRITDEETIEEADLFSHSPSSSPSSSCSSSATVTTVAHHHRAKNVKQQQQQRFGPHACLYSNATTVDTLFTFDASRLTPDDAEEITREVARIVRILLRVNRMHYPPPPPAKTVPPEQAESAEEELLERLAVKFTNYYSRVVSNIIALIYHSSYIERLAQERHDKHEKQGKSSYSTKITVSVTDLSTVLLPDSAATTTSDPSDAFGVVMDEEEGLSLLGGYVKLAPLSSYRSVRELVALKDLCAAILLNALTDRLYMTDTASNHIHVWTADPWLSYMKQQGLFERIVVDYNIIVDPLNYQSHTSTVENSGGKKSYENLFFSKDLKTNAAIVHSALASYKQYAMWLNTVIFTENIVPVAATTTSPRS
jgi:hypothetical protein